MDVWKKRRCLSEKQKERLFRLQGRTAKWRGDLREEIALGDLRWLQGKGDVVCFYDNRGTFFDRRCGIDYKVKLLCNGRIRTCLLDVKSKLSQYNADNGRPHILKWEVDILTSVGKRAPALLTAMKTHIALLDKNPRLLPFHERRRRIEAKVNMSKERRFGGC